MAQIHKLAAKTREAAEAREAAIKAEKDARHMAANAMMERELVLAALYIIQGGPIVIPHDVIQQARAFVGRVRLDAVDIDVIVPRPVAFWQRLKQRFTGGGPVPKVRALQLSIDPPAAPKAEEPADVTPPATEPETPAAPN